MELMTLDESFQPNRIIENYSNLIWTERYAKNGDFTLASNAVAETINMLPRESYLTLRESTVPMIVEDHKITKTPRGNPTVTVTGRSFETVLERRAAVNTLPVGSARVPWTIQAEKESDAAYKAMRIVLGDSAKPLLLATSPAVSPLDAIPEIDLTHPADYVASTLNTYEIQPENLYKAVIELINTNRRGLKAVRPVVGFSKVGIEIYNGADLTNDVVFDARFDQFDDTTYLLSERGSTNVGYIYGSNGSQIVPKTAAPEPSGLARRVLVLDQTSDTTTNTVDIRRSRGLIELYKYNPTALFDGQIAIQVAEGYGTVYHLGDILKLTGEYGLSQNVRVAEYIRTSDATGEKAYPAFEAVA